MEDDLNIEIEEIPNFNVIDGLAKFTLSLYEHYNVPKETIDKIISNFDCFIRDSFIPHLNDRISEEFEADFEKQYQFRAEATLKKEENPFYFVKTEKTRLSLYKNRFRYCEPVKYKISDATLKKNSSTNDVYGAHIPLAVSLKNILEIPGIFNEIISYKNMLQANDNLISNVMQTENWKNRYESADKLVLPLFPYFDDFEPGNALGSHAGKQKLGGFYVLLPFLPPHLVAKLENILLVSLFYSNYRSTYGNRAVFYQAIDELNLLSTKGIEINIEGVKRHVYFKCPLIYGDNLALNQICGFVQSFRTDYFCRICKSTYVQTQHMFKEDSSLIRTKESYEEDVLRARQTNQPHGGVVEPCIFNELIDFHISQNGSLDLMHDWFEGVCGDTLSKILSHLIYNLKLFSLKEVNVRIKNFPFDKNETSVPCEIHESKSKKTKNNKIKLKQSASEMSCLVRYLDFIIGDLIPDKRNSQWDLYILMKEITLITLSPRYRPSQLEYLAYIIERFNEQYYNLFGKLKPKFHFIIHIPLIMKQNGPIVHFWSMTGERKNKMLKEIAVSTASNRNLPLTVAVRNQLHHCYVVHNYSINRRNFIEFSKKKINRDFQIGSFNDLVTEAASYDFVNICGKRYQHGTAIVTKIDDDGCQFGKICKIFKVNDRAFFLVSDVISEYYDHERQAYKVQVETFPNKLYDSSILPKIPPCFLTILKENYYVLTKYLV